MENGNGKFKSRKFILAVCIVVLASLFLALNYIGPDEWVKTIGIVAGLYMGGNVAQKIGGK